MQEPIRALTNKVIHILNRFDPMGLTPGMGDGTPWDEYEPEARDLAAILQASGTITGAQVDAIWFRWFGQNTDAADAIATSLRSAAPRRPR
ncbi:hypothetical protein [Homoserinimonas hongtaonis]|nr:hypothetical protein [Salinibacterium hongtaonis]AWB88540.1 hypothetical protein C2138_02335 [Salinibacterium hongtaonis]